MKIVLTCTFLLTLSSVGLAASPCSPDWKPPKLYGIRLGMTTKQVRARFPSLKVSRPDKFQVRDAFFYVVGRRGSKYKLPQSVFAVEALFLRGLLVRYQVKYYESGGWKSLDEFVARMSAALDLVDEQESASRNFHCNDVEIIFWEDSSKSITFFDRSAKSILDRRIDESYSKRQ